jgi:hypothetical protein
MYTYMLIHKLCYCYQGDIIQQTWTIQANVMRHDAVRPSSQYPCVDQTV